MDGLWSVSFGGYGPFGWEVSFGQDPNGQGFLTCRVGVGKGGGISYDPFGGRPGGVSARQSNRGGLTAGLYGEVGGEAGVPGIPLLSGSGKIQTNAGVDIVNEIASLARCSACTSPFAFGKTLLARRHTPCVLDY